ncbi:MAG TPA: imidazoleglycerol-phosphate dehydratase, partial [Turneriella sp.]|nr:imidazoleglycerol-phosphate dehydratase [Turneriella sp.]
MRTAQIERKTNETAIRLALNLDGTAKMTGENPIAFFEHMLGHIVKYSMFDLDLHLKGDLAIDCHHSVEDTGIILGDALRQALGNKGGIFRYG